MPEARRDKLAGKDIFYRLTSPVYPVFSPSPVLRTYPLAPFLKEGGTVTDGCTGLANVPEWRFPFNESLYGKPAKRQPAFLPLSFRREGRGERSEGPGGEIPFTSSDLVYPGDPQFNRLCQLAYFRINVHENARIIVSFFPSVLRQSRPSECMRQPGPRP